MNDLFTDTINQLNKLSIRKMQFQITKVDFIIDETMSTTWEASDPDDLIEEITSATGWCINSIDYRHILK